MTIGKKKPEKITKQMLLDACDKEQDEVLQEFKENKKNEVKRFRQYTDSEYWICIVFQTREQKDEYLEKAKLKDIGQKYLDGMKVAKRQDIELDNKPPKWHDKKGG